MTDAKVRVPKRIQDRAAELWARQQTGDPEAARRLSDWLAADERNRVAYEAIARDWADSADLGQTSLGRNRKLHRAPFYMRHSTHVALATVGAVVLLGSSALWFSGLSSQVLNPVGVVKAASFATGLGEIRAFKLPDGTRLTLDTNSRVSARRERGDLHLEVMAGRVRVAPAARTSVVLATPTSRDTQVSGGPFDVTLLEGPVSIAAVAQPIRLETKGQSSQIVPGETAQLNLAAISKRRMTATQMQWTSGMIILNATTTKEAVRAINRYNRDQVRIRVPGLDERRISGAYEARDPMTFAQAVARMFDLTVTRTPGEILITR